MNQSRILRPALKSDLPDIVRVHQAAFPGFFLTNLGPGFLQHYYGFVLEYRRHILLVAEGPGGVAGFACGFTEPGAFYRYLRSHRTAFLWPIATALIRNPRILHRLFHRILLGYARVSREAHHDSPDICELSSIAVDPGQQGGGLGSVLLRAFLATALGGARTVTLTTDADGNQAVNDFYRRHGFHLESTFMQAKTRRMNRYCLSSEIIADVDLQSHLA